MHGSEAEWMNLFLQDKFNSTTKGKKKIDQRQGKKRLCSPKQTVKISCSYLCTITTKRLC